MTVLDGSVDITPGVRVQRVRADNFAANGDRSSSYDEYAVTPMLGFGLPSTETRFAVYQLH